MEQDEMKLAWKELNEKITASALANEETLAYILKTRRKTAWQKLARADKSASIFLVLLAIGVIYYMIFIDQGAALIKIQAVILILAACALNVIGYQKLIRMKLEESVPLLYKQVSSYKKLMVWAYLICYILVFIFVISLLLVYPLPHFAKIGMFLTITVAVAIDYFIFHWSSDHIHTLVDTTKELKNLKELNKLE